MNIKSKVVQKANKAKQWYEENQRAVDVSAQIVVAASAMYFAHKYFKEKDKTKELMSQSYGIGYVTGVESCVGNTEDLANEVNIMSNYCEAEGQTDIIKGMARMMKHIQTREDD